MHYATPMLLWLMVPNVALVADTKKAIIATIITFPLAAGLSALLYYS